MIPRKLVAVFAGACLLSLPNPALCKARNEQNRARKEERVEIKYLVPEDNIEMVSKNLHLDADHPSAMRVICFYDTDAMALFSHSPKAILRSRYSTGTDQYQRRAWIRSQRSDGNCQSAKENRDGFEVSTKVPLSQAAQATIALSKVLGIMGTEKQEEETKTKIVLEHFAQNAADGVKP